MKTIVLTQGKVALVDDGDFEFLSKFKWHAHKDRHTYYARAKRGGATLRMHRLICGDPEPGFVIDHINGDGLDNRRENLRIVPRSINRLSAKMSSHNTSGHRGASFSKRDKVWSSRLTYRQNGKKVTLYLGVFPSREEAEQAYFAAVQERYGKFKSRATT